MKDSMQINSAKESEEGEGEGSALYPTAGKLVAVPFSCFSWGGGGSSNLAGEYFYVSQWWSNLNDLLQHLRPFINKVLGKGPKKKILYVNFFQIGVDPPPPPFGKSLHFDIFLDLSLTGLVHCTAQT